MHAHAQTDVRRWRGRSQPRSGLILLLLLLFIRARVCVCVGCKFARKYTILFPVH